MVLVDKLQQDTFFVRQNVSLGVEGCVGNLEVRLDVEKSIGLKGGFVRCFGRIGCFYKTLLLLSTLLRANRIFKVT